MNKSVPANEWNLLYEKGGIYLDMKSAAGNLDSIIKENDTFLCSPITSKISQEIEAKIKGYEGEACGECGNFTLVRNGTCMKCNTCGATSGCS